MEQQPRSETLRLPTPRQLQVLSAVALGAANSAKKLQYRHTPFEPVHSWVDAYDVLKRGNDRYYMRFSGRRAQRVLRGVDHDTQHENVAMYDDSWSLRYRELQQQYLDGTWVGGLKTYLFEWDNVGAFVSQCYDRVVPSLEADEILRIEALEDELGIELNEGLAPTWSSSKVVTAHDVAQMIGSIRRRHKSLLEQEEQRRKMKRSYPGATRTDVETELTKKEAKNPLFYYQSPNEEK